MAQRECAFIMTSGQHCQSPPLLDGEYCLMHSPEHAQGVTEARRLGGLRRRREVTVSGVYDFVGLESVADIRRLIEIAVLDTLGLDNSIARARTLAYLAHSALKALEVGELESRLAVLEQAVIGTRRKPDQVFDADVGASDFPREEAAD